MATVYFTSYKGPGVPHQLDIHPDVARQVERRCEALALAVAGYPVGRIATGSWKGAFEPSFVADHLSTGDARRLAKAACTVFEQECVLVFTPDADGAHVRATVPERFASRAVAILLSDGYTVLPDGRHVFVLAAGQELALPEDIPCAAERGTADSVMGPAALSRHRPPPRSTVMPVTIPPTGAVLITGKFIEGARLITLKHALRLELFGMKRRGPSAYTILRTEYGYTGTRSAVLAAVTADVDRMLGRPEEKDQSTP